VRDPSFLVQLPVDLGRLGLESQRELQQRSLPRRRHPVKGPERHHPGRFARRKGVPKPPPDEPLGRAILVLQPVVSSIQLGAEVLHYLRLYDGLAYLRFASRFKVIADPSLIALDAASVLAVEIDET